jgi:hypothetical protein
MVKDYSQWNKSDIIGEPNRYYGISPKKTINISESWNILNESSSNLNRLDEHGFTASFSRDEFINEAFPGINESANEYTKDKIYALYETQLFYTHREDWFNQPSKNNQTPLILESETHYIIIHNDKSFALTKESYDILMYNDINEGFFGDLWDGIKDVGSAIGGFFSDAFDAVKSRLGKWADTISDAAKSVVGFMGTCLKAISAFAGSDWLSMVQTLSSLFRGVFGTVGSFLFPGTAGVVTSVVGGATGLLGLYAGYDRISKPYGEIEGAATKAKDAKELGTSLSKIGPELISGTSNMMVGAKDIISALSPSDSSPLGGISDIAALFSSDTKESLQKQGESLFGDDNAEAIGKTLFAMAKVNEAEGVDLAKSLKTNMLTMGGIISLEYVIPGIKDTVIDGAKSVSEGVQSALDIPNKIDKFLGGANDKSKEEGGSSSILGSALGFIRKPIVNGLKSMCDAVKGPVESATTVIGDVPKKFKTVLKSIDKNGGDFDLEEVEIAETEKVEEPEKMVKLEKDDIEAIKSNKKEILALKESKCVDFETWSRLTS